jgi:hypothetical protein
MCVGTAWVWQAARAQKARRPSRPQRTARVVLINVYRWNPHRQHLVKRVCLSVAEAEIGMSPTEPWSFVSAKWCARAAGAALLIGAGGFGLMLEPKQHAREVPVDSATAAPFAASRIDLSAEQRRLLAPLLPRWEQMSEERRTQWLEIARRMRAMPQPLRERVLDRMEGWADLSPVERRRARLRYQLLRTEDRGRLQQLWIQYQQLDGRLGYQGRTNDTFSAIGTVTARPTPGATTVLMTDLVVRPLGTNSSP